MPAAVDTNVLVRVLVPDSPRQTRSAVAALERAGLGWVSHVVLHETVWVLYRVYQFSHESVASIVEQLLVEEHFAIEEPVVVRAALARLRERPEVGFNDCLILEIARARGRSPLLTFDDRLSKFDGCERLDR